VNGGHGLQPDRLPDAGYGRVPNAAGFQHLLAVKLVSRVGGVGDADGECVGAGTDRAGNVEGERQVAARVGADLRVVDPDRGLVIHRLEVQQQAVAVAQRRRLEAAAIPQGVRRGETLLHAGQRRLDGERHEDLARPFRRRGGDGIRRDLVIPEAVEVAPRTAGQRRPRVFPPGGFGRDLGPPVREHRIGRRLPGLGRGLCDKNSGEHKAEFHRITFQGLGELPIGTSPD